MNKNTSKCLFKVGMWITFHAPVLFFVQNVSSWEMVVFLNSFHSVEALQANLDFDFNLIWLQMAVGDGWPEVLTVESDWGTRCQQGSSCSYLLVHANVEGSWSVDVKVLLYRHVHRWKWLFPHQKIKLGEKKGKQAPKSVCRLYVSWLLSLFPSTHPCTVTTHTLQDCMSILQHQANGGVDFL